MEDWQTYISENWEQILAIVGGVLLGVWADGSLNTTPLFTLLGLGLGLTVAFYGLYKMMLPWFERRDDRSK